MCMHHADLHADAEERSEAHIRYEDLTKRSMSPAHRSLQNVWPKVKKRPC